eukprot:7391911-Prymnesium_polylepis.2
MSPSRAAQRIRTFANNRQPLSRFQATCCHNPRKCYQQQFSRPASSKPPLSPTNPSSFRCQRRCTAAIWPRAHRELRLRNASSQHRDSSRDPVRMAAANRAITVPVAATHMEPNSTSHARTK